MSIPPTLYTILHTTSGEKSPVQPLDFKWDSPNAIDLSSIAFKVYKPRFVCIMAVIHSHTHCFRHIYSKIPNK